MPSPSRVRAPLARAKAQERSVRRRHDDVGHHQVGSHAVRVDVDERLAVAEPDGRGIDHDAGAARHGIGAVPGNVRRRHPGARGDHPRELLTAAHVAIDDDDGCRAGECRLDGDRAGRSPGAEHDDLETGRVELGAQ